MTSNVETMRERQHQQCGRNLDFVAQGLPSAGIILMKGARRFPDLSEFWKACPMTTRRNRHISFTVLGCQ